MRYEFQDVHAVAEFFRTKVERANNRLNRAETEKEKTEERAFRAAWEAAASIVEKTIFTKDKIDA